MADTLPLELVPVEPELLALEQAAKTPAPAVLPTRKRTVVPKRFFSPPLPAARFKQQAKPALKGPRCAAAGAKRARELHPLGQLQESKRARQHECAEEGEWAEEAERNEGEQGAAPPPTAAGGDADVSGLDLLFFASEATPFKVGGVLGAFPVHVRAAMPLASPLGQLAHLVATSPFAYVPGGNRMVRAGGPGAGVGRKVVRLAPAGRGYAVPAGTPSIPTMVCSPPALHAATSLVTRLAPVAAAAAAARWLDVLASDLRARHAALRKSRGRLARSLASLAEGRTSPEAATAALLLRQLDGALEGEEATLGMRLRELQGVRTMCGAPEGEALRTGPITTWGAVPEPKYTDRKPSVQRPLTCAQAAAASSAVILTAAAAADASVAADE